tara:strand:+ start:10388 stop:12331 length:1944 start_codon:yes stop_codon:yes gene_type:complete
MKIRKSIFYWFVVVFCSIFSINGQTYQEIQKLKDEYNKALEKQSLQKPENIVEAERRAGSTAIPDKLVYSRKDIESLLVNTQKLLDELESLKDSTRKLEYIGYDFFTKRDSIPFWQNLPPPENYKLGPGDEVIISLWGEIQSYNVVIINREGQIYLDDVGILNLGDKSLSEAKKYAMSSYSNKYSTLLGPNPKSFIDLSLGELKSVNVHFVGFANIPGVHTIHPFSNVISGLIQAGGVDRRGSLRRIQVIRSNEIISEFDIYDYMVDGLSKGDIRLLDQDIIKIPPRNTTIALTGRVLRPGYFEIKNNESLDDLIKIAGGLDTKASSSIFVYRKEASENKSEIIKQREWLNFKISNEDSIHVPSIAKYDNFVTIGGQVINAGKFPYENDMKLEELLDATNSLKNKNFSKTMDLSQIQITRVNKKGERPLRITSNFNEENIVLNNGDVITVPMNRNNRKIETAIITGEVKIPGIYGLNKLTTLADIIELAGGFTGDALYKGVEIFRDSLKIAWDNESFILENNDSLNVIKKSGLVLVKGEVNKPGFITYKKGMNINRYIEKAGGLNDFASEQNIYIVYPNGIASLNDGLFSPNVLEGSTIVINSRKITSYRRNMTGWEIFSTLSSQAGNIATTLLSIAILSSQINGTN